MHFFELTFAGDALATGMDTERLFEDSVQKLSMIRPPCSCKHGFIDRPNVQLGSVPRRM